MQTFVFIYKYSTNVTTSQLAHFGKIRQHLYYGKKITLNIQTYNYYLQNIVTCNSTIDLYEKYNATI